MKGKHFHQLCARVWSGGGGGERRGNTFGIVALRG